jgi:hypothetical protein
MENYNLFKENLKNSNIDFTVLLTKSNGDRDDIPNEEEVLIAA